MLVTQFTTDEEDSPAEKGAPEYAFEGFNIEFSEKIALTPLNPSRGTVAKTFRLEPKVDKLDEMPSAPFKRIEADEDRREARWKIIQLAAASDIARFPWADRGVAPIGYIKGMALVYAKVFCKFKGGDPAAVEMAKAKTGNAAQDTLVHLAAEFKAAGMNNDAAGADTLRHLFVLLIGLGMRESSGQFCIGRFNTANNNAETAEAGLFQTSFNARLFNNALMTQLFEQYRANPEGFLEVFKEGVPACSTRNLENVGAGDGKEFQRLSKASPAFAAEFTAVALRNTSQHWEPIVKKLVQIRPECDDMLRRVQDLVDDQKLCPLLL